MGTSSSLTVEHDDFEPGSTAATMVRNGWPVVLSSLKTLIKTGEPLSSTRSTAIEANLADLRALGEASVP